MGIAAGSGDELGNAAGLRLPYAIWAVLCTAFFCNTWEEYHIREFILPVVNGPSEGLVATELMPGIDPARDIIAASHGRVRVAENAKVLPLSLLSPAAMELTL